MAEMTTLLAAVYRRYTTSEQERQKGMSPAITSRFEVFYDEKYTRISVSQPLLSSRPALDSHNGVQEHACFIDFHRR